MSIDGFIAGPNGEMDWMEWNWDEALKDYVKDITAPVDCIVLGRKLAEGFIPYWAANRGLEGADKMNGTQKIVFTKTLDKSVWENTVLASGELTAEINNLKKQDGKDIIAYGGACFVSALVEHDLIDEYHLIINPASIGKGMAIFNVPGSRKQFTLIKSTSFACGIVVLCYKPKDK